MLELDDRLPVERYLANAPPLPLFSGRVFPIVPVIEEEWACGTEEQAGA